MTRKNAYIFAAVLAVFLCYRFIAGVLTTDVIVAKARRDTAIMAVTGTITVLGEVETQLLSTGHGFIIESNLEEGMDFTKGKELVVIDPGRLLFSIRTTEAEINALKANIKRGSSSSISLRAIERKIKLSEGFVGTGQLSQTDYDDMIAERDLLKHQSESEKDSWDTQLKVKQNTLDDLNDQLRRLTILAPMNGTVTSVKGYPGDLMGVGKPLADIISSTMKISAEVNQDDIAVIKQGGPANIRFFAYGDRLYKARVRQILPSNDKTTQRFTVYLDMLEEPENMMPGMTGEVSFFTDERANAIIIPRQALLGNSVFVVNNDKLVLREVVTGFLSYSDAEIIEGIEEGELVVTEDIDFLHDGDRVRVKQIIGE